MCIIFVHICICWLSTFPYKVVFSYQSTQRAQQHIHFIIYCHILNERKIKIDFCIICSSLYACFFFFSSTWQCTISKDSTLETQYKVKLFIFIYIILFDCYIYLILLQIVCWFVVVGVCIISSFRVHALTIFSINVR